MNRLARKNIELPTNGHAFRTQVLTATDIDYDKLYLSVIMVKLIVFRLYFYIGPLARFPPYSPNLVIKCFVDSVTCLEIISPALTSGNLFSAIWDTILPPVRKVSRESFGCVPKDGFNPTK